MSKWIRNVQGWVLGVLGLLAVSSLAEAKEITIVGEGYFTSTGSVVSSGDTYVAEITYETDTANITPTSTTMGQYPGAVVGSRITFKRNGEVYGVATCDTSNTVDNRVIILRGYYGSTDDMYVYTRVIGTSNTGGNLGGRFGLRLSGALGTVVPSDLSIPLTLPTNGTWSGSFYTSTTIYHHVDSVVQKPAAGSAMAWSYAGTITYLPSYSPLYGLLQYGDTVTGTMVYSLSRPNTSSGVNATYPAAVLIHEYVVLRNGEPIWSGSFRFGASTINVQATPSGSVNQLFEIVSEMVPSETPPNTSTYETRFALVDYSGSDMLQNTDLPSSVPENWEGAFLLVSIDGSLAMRATLQADSLTAIDTTECEVCLTALTECVDTYEETVAALGEQNASLERTLDEFTSDGLVAWNYAATVTSVTAGTPLAGVIQVGDTVSGNRIMHTDLVDTDANTTHAMYNDSVVSSDTIVTRADATVWEASHTGPASPISLYTSPQRVYFYDDQKGGGTYNDGNLYSVAIVFLDESGSDLLVGESLPTEPPANWERAFVYIRYNGVAIVTAELAAGNITNMSLANHVSQLQEQSSELVALRELAVDLLGEGAATWKFEAQITEVTAGAALDGVVQVGDTISGFRVMDATVPDTSASTTEGIYTNPVRLARTAVSHNGDFVWVADGQDMSSRVYLSTAYLSNGQSGYVSSFEKRVDAEEEGYYDVVFFFYSDDQDMLADDSIPAVPPTSWDRAYVQIRKNGMVLAKADFTMDSLKPMAMADHAGLEETLALLNADLEEQLATADAEIVSMSEEIDQQDTEIANLETQAAALEQQVDGLVGTHYAAWKYEAQFTNVDPGSALGGTVQVGDTLACYVVLNRDTPDLDANNSEHSYFLNSVVMAEASIVRDGEVIWSMRRNVASGLAELYTNIPTTGRQQVMVSCKVGSSPDAQYETQMLVVDYFDCDLLPGEEIPVTPPDHWDWSHVVFRVNGTSVAVGELVPGSLVSLSIPDHIEQEIELQASAIALQEQLDAANADVVAKQAQIDALTADLATANADIVAKQAQIDTLTADLATANADIVAKQAQIDALTTDLATANADIVVKQAQIDVLTAEKADLQQQLDAANADIVAKQGQIDTLTADLAQANAEIAALTNELAVANATIGELTQTVSDLETANAAFEEQVTSVTASMAALEAALADEFNDPNFAIPGDTPEAKAASLQAAILSLNPGQRQALFAALGGNKNAR